MFVFVRLLCVFIVCGGVTQLKSEEEFGSRVNFIPIIDVLVRQTEHEDDFNRVNAMEWLSKFIKLGGNKLIVVIDKLVGAVLKCLSDQAVRLSAGAAGRLLLLCWYMFSCTLHLWCAALLLLCCVCRMAW